MRGSKGRAMMLARVGGEEKRALFERATRPGGGYVFGLPGSGD